MWPRRGWLLVALLLVGCTLRPIFTETGDPGDPVRWRTESRMQWRLYGAPVGQQPVDVYFLSQEACEGFRERHPTYTKPEEVCQEVHGTSSSVPGWKR